VGMHGFQPAQGTYSAFAMVQGFQGGSHANTQ